MAAIISRPFLMNVLAPGGVLNTNLLNLETKTYTRRYTNGQVLALKFMTNRFLKKLGVARYINDVTVNKTEGGQPGCKDTYRVRIRYK